jgi:hypothetical protein
VTFLSLNRRVVLFAILFLVSPELIAQKNNNGGSQPLQQNSGNQNNQSAPSAPGITGGTSPIESVLFSYAALAADARAIAGGISTKVPAGSTVVLTVSSDVSASFSGAQSLRGQRSGAWVGSSLRKKAPSSLTKSVSCPQKLKSRCCVFCRNGSLSGWVAVSRFELTCGSSPPAIATWRLPSPRVSRTANEAVSRRISPGNFDGA